jgi:DNA helicase HerA-like ATPase
VNKDTPKNPFSHHRFIGYVSKVAPDITQIHFPNSNLLKKFYHEGEVLHGGVVRNFVIIEGEDCGFLAKIISVELPEKERSFLSEKSFLNDDKMQPIGRVEIQLAFEIFGDPEKGMKAKKGLDQYPPVGAKVYVCSSKFLAQFLKDFGKKEDCADLLKIATLPQDESLEIEISANALFGRHLAIVGTTGGGKSFTIAKLIEEMLAKEQGVKIVLLDATGEFDGLGSDKKEEVERRKFGKNDGGNIYLDCKNLTESDLFALFPPSENSQAPILYNAIKSLKLAKILKDEKYSGELLVNDLINKTPETRRIYEAKYFEYAHKIEAPDAYFDLTKLNEQIDKECITEFWAADGKARGYCTTLKMKVSTKLFNSDFSHVFGFNEEVKKEKSDLETRFKSFYDSQTEKLLIINTSQVSSEGNLREILINAIGRFFLKKAQTKTEGGEKLFAENPLILFLDEAHQAFRVEKIKDEYFNEFKLDAFERIAKECRKFGLFLCLATQRPRDIPQGVLSQMGCFLAHRLINEFDRQAIENASPQGSKYVLSFLPSLSEGETILMGVDFPMPINLKIAKPKNEPNSQTPKLFK